jgi:hypothetical protein
MQLLATNNSPSKEGSAAAAAAEAIPKRARLPQELLLVDALGRLDKVALTVKGSPGVRFAVPVVAAVSLSTRRRALRLALLLLLALGARLLLQLDR